MPCTFQLCRVFKRILNIPRRLKPICDSGTTLLCIHATQACGLPVRLYQSIPSTSYSCHLCAKFCHVFFSSSKCSLALVCCSHISNILHYFAAVPQDVNSKGHLLPCGKQTLCLNDFFAPHFRYKSFFLMVWNHYNAHAWLICTASVKGSVIWVRL